MFLVRKAQESDLREVHGFTIRLLCHHIGQGSQSRLNYAEFEELFRSGHLSGLVLEYHGDVEVRLPEPTLIGCMIFHSDHSPIHGGRGIALDQFYIEPEFRRQGLGRRMMCELCQHGLNTQCFYIKLVYQDGLGLEHVYGRLGFRNETRQEPGLHLFEAYGLERLEAFLHCDVGRISSPVRQLVIPLSSSHILQSEQSPAWKVYQTQEQTSEWLMTASTAYLVLLQLEDPRSQRNGLCAFIEQMAVCSWLGRMVIFSEFSGDLQLLSKELLISRVRTWTKLVPTIKGAVWEVPCGASNCRPLEIQGKIIDKPDTSKLNFNPLAEKLYGLDVSDDTMREGWNLTFLDREGMQRLANSLIENENQ